MHQTDADHLMLDVNVTVTVNVNANVNVNVDANVNLNVNLDLKVGMKINVSVNVIVKSFESAAHFQVVSRAEQLHGRRVLRTQNDAAHLMLLS